MQQIVQYTLFDNNLIAPVYGNRDYLIKGDLKFIDLFAGIGGFRIALERIGAKCVFSSEWDKYAVQTYVANFGEQPCGDISKISTSQIPDCDILCAGFPCQPFSSIGKREGFQHKTQGTLFYEIIKILQDKKPIAFILENVPGIVNHDGGKTLETILESLNQINYDVSYQLLNAADYGIPQHRNRIYFVGLNRNYNSNAVNYTFPEGKKDRVEIGQYIESHYDKYCISQHLQQTYLFKKDDGRPQLVDRNSDICVKTLVSTYHKIQRLTGTFVKDGKTGIRLLSENECKAIMGFDRDFVIPVSRTQMYRQFGNSVAIPVVTEIARNLVKKIKKMNVVYTSN